MALLFLLNGKELQLAAAEATASLHPKDWWRRVPTTVDGTAYFPAARRAPRGLALTHRIVRVFAVAESDAALERAIKRVPWRRVLRGTFVVRLTSSIAGGPSERDLAALVDAGNARVDLTRPDVTIDIVRLRDRAYVGVRAWENAEDWESRRAHRWSEPHPTALHPKIARALLRLAGARRIHDPCCGAGGVLIEAGLAGLRASGGDVNQSMVRRARANARAYGLHPELRVADATAWIPRAGAIVTDLPYGRSTRAVRTGPFVEALLLRAAQSTRRAVIGSPEPLPNVPGWAVRAHMTSYAHKSLTRHFTVLERA